MFRRSPFGKATRNKTRNNRLNRMRHEMLEDRVLLVTDLGTGGSSLIGNDLTDRGDNGVEGSYAPPSLAGFDAEFFGNDEPNFNPPNNEGAFNVFDNLKGGGQNKWCCNSANVAGGIHVGANFSNTLLAGSSATDGIILTHFTITSDNDSGTARDPDIWRIQGSNDGSSWTDIFVYNQDGNSPFDDFGSPENRTLLYEAGTDYAQPAPFKQFRYLVTSSVNNANHSLGEIEFFSDLDAIDDDYTASAITEDQTFNVIEGTTDLLHNDSGVPLAIINSDVVSANGATVSVNPDGSFTYNAASSASLQTLDQGQMLTDTFTYEISDGVGTFQSGPFNIDVYRDASIGASMASADNYRNSNPPTNSGTVTQADILSGGGNQRFSVNNNPPGGGGNNYAVYMTGYLNVTVAGDYTFGTYTDDNSRIRIDLDQDGVLEGNLTSAGGSEMGGGGTVVYQGSCCHHELGSVVNLPVGVYLFEAVYTEGGGGDHGEFYYTQGDYGSYNGPGGATAFDDAVANGANFALIGDGSQGIEAGTLVFSSNDTATVSVLVNGVNDAPNANDDVNSISEAMDGVPASNTVIGNVLTNDSDVDDPNSSFTVTQIQNTASGVDMSGTIVGDYGTLTWNTNTGEYTYTLDDANPTVEALGLGQSLSDSFNYTMSDNHSGGNIKTDGATLTITINGSDDTPTAQDNSATVTEDGPLTDSGNVITDNDGSGVDSDPEGVTLITLEVDGQSDDTVDVAGTYGSLDWNTDGSYTYSLDNGNPAVQAIDDGQTLTDTFTYTAAEPLLNNDGLFTITALAADPGGGSNDNDLNSTTETLGIWDAIDSGATVPGLVSAGSNYNIARYETGTATQVLYNGNRNGYTGTAAYSTIGGGSITGGDDFSVRARAYLQFTVGGTYSIAGGSDDGRRIKLTEATPGSAPGYTGFNSPGEGQHDDSADPNVVFFNGTTGHNYTTGVFSVAAGDVLELDAFFFERGGGDSFNLAIKNGNDTGHGGTGDGWALLSDGQFGIELSSIEPQLSDTATLTVTINGVNDAPTIDNNGNVAVTEGDTATNSGSFNDVDTTDNVSLTASVGMVTGGGVNNGTWNWSWPTNNGPAQSQMVTITADDGTVQTTTTFMLTVDNDPPTLTLDPVANIDENDSVTLTGGYSDSGTGDSHTVVVDWDDPNATADSTFAVPAINTLNSGDMINSSTDGAVLTVTSVNTTTGDVEFSIAAHTYLDDGLAPGNGTASDPASIMVSVTDSDSAGAGAVANITVSNLPPSGGDDANTTDEDVVLNVAAPGLLTGDTDVGTLDVLTVTEINGSGSLAGTSQYGAQVTLNSDGSYTYDPTNAAALQALSAGEMITDTFTYTVTDDDGATDTALVSIMVTSTDDIEANTSFDHVFSPFAAPPGVDTPIVPSAVAGADTVMLVLNGGTLDLMVNGNLVRTTTAIGSGANVNVVGQAADTLYVNDLADGTGDTASIDFDSIDGVIESGSVITHSIGNVTIDAGDDADNYTLNNLAGGVMTSVTVNGNAGEDTFITTPQSVTVNVNGNSPVLPADPGDTLVLDLTAEPVPLVIPTTVDGSFNSSNVANAPINWLSIENFIINGEVVPVNRLFVEATSGSDRIIFFPTSNDEFQVRINNQYFPSTTTGFDALAIEAIEAVGREGSDRIIVAGRLDIPVEFDGGLGNDYLAGGINDDTLIGGDGNDILLAGEGDNVLSGGIGSDRLEGRDGNDIIFGGDGTDRLVGNGGNDILDGGNDNDFVFGGLGDDLLVGGSGTDTLQGHYGNDVIFGGDHADQLFGGYDDDILFGGAGIDRVRGDVGNDDIIGGNSSIEGDLDTALAAMLATLGTDLATADPTVAAAINAWQSTGSDRSGFGTLIDDGAIDDLAGGNGIDPNWTDEFHSANDYIRDLRTSEGDSMIP